MHTPTNRSGFVRNAVIVAVMLMMLGSVLWNVARGGMVASAMDSRNPQLVTAGQGVYTANCARCHGARLEGQPNWQTPNADGSMPAPPHDANGHTWHHGADQLFSIVKYGGQSVSPPGYKNAMPAFGTALSGRELWAVLSYIKSTWPPQIQAAQEQASGK